MKTGIRLSVLVAVSVTAMSVALAQDITKPDAAGRIGNWLVLGAFPDAGACGGNSLADYLDPTTTFPMPGDTDQARTWQHYVPSVQSGHYKTFCGGACNAGFASVDFNCFLSNRAQAAGCPDRTTGYAYTSLCFDADTTAVIYSDADDGWRYWIDGALIYANPANCRCYGNDWVAARRTYSFSKGCHDVLVQVNEGGGHFGFVWGLRTTAGAAMTTGVSANAGGLVSDTPSYQCPCIPDADADGICDNVDQCPGIYTPDNEPCPPACTDADKDSICDSGDNCLGVPNTGQEDTDEDGLGDACDLVVDTDGDGTPDDSDGCPTDPGKVSPGACGCGTADTDSDSDGTADCIDGCPSDAGKTAPGVCGCGTADTDSDSDGTADCIDGCPSDAGKTAPGVCGCGTADTDSDADGTADCIDNCLDLANDQSDQDLDGTGDACDVCPYDPDDDGDGDGVCGDVDLCPGTTADAPTEGLGTNRFADVDGDGQFDTVAAGSNGKGGGKATGPGKSYTTTDTQGCGCTQIIAACGYGEGHTKFGCSISVMDEWTNGDGQLCK